MVLLRDYHSFNHKFFVYLCNYLNTRELSHIQRDHCLDIDKGIFKAYFKETTSESYNFFLIDKKTKELRYRKNLDTIIENINEQ